MNKKIITSESEMIKFGEEFAKSLTFPACIQLIGDVGVGKTTFMRGLARGLGVIEPITSPSFTISRVYAFGDGTLVHYDFYRLDEPGLMLDDLRDSLSLDGSVVAIEWAGDAEGILPDDHIRLTISLNDDGTRTIEY